MHFPNYLSALGITTEPAAEVSLVVQEYTWFYCNAHGSWSTAMQTSIEFGGAFYAKSSPYYLATSLYYLALPRINHKSLAAAFFLVPRNEPDTLLSSPCSAATGAHKSARVWGARRRGSESLPNMFEQRAACTAPRTSRIPRWIRAPELLPSCFSKKPRCVPFSSRQRAFWLWTRLANGRNDGC